MVPLARYAFISMVLLVIGYFSWRTYLYYSDTTTPDVSFVGVENNGYCCADVAVTIKGYSPYKIATVSVWLDGVLLHNAVKINKKHGNYTFTLPTKNLTDGQHVMQALVVDGTKHQNSNSASCTFYVDNQGLQATVAMSPADHKVQQGRCLHVQLQANKPMIEAKVKALSGVYNCFAKSKNASMFEVFIPCECDLIAQEYPFVLEVKDHMGNTVILEDVFQVTAVPFKKKILYVPNNRLKSELEFTALQERDLEEALDSINKKSAQEKLWSGAFDVPILMRGISTEFGVIRTSQERGRTVHKALDITADPKSVIWAANNGIIVLKDRFTHSGNTVVIDHGCGIVSMYFHLQDYADICVGQKVKKGNPLGHMGMTGFANGPHLHWEIRVNNNAVDPMQWTQLIG